MRFTFYLVTIFSVLSLFSPTVRAADELPSYNAKRTTGAITIDGRLDEKDWLEAKEARLKDRTTGLDVPMKTTVRVLWDDIFLYIAFYGDDNDAWTTFTNDDDNLWEQEVFEMFIDPEGKGHTYYEININPINKIVDLFIMNGGESRKGEMVNTKAWNFRGLKHGVYVEGDGKNEGTKDSFWTAELAIPFEELWTADYYPPKPGDMWRMNFYRIERGKSDTENDDWRAAFSYTKGLTFHTPWLFGKVYFVK